jgi:hypothetical protein
MKKAMFSLIALVAVAATSFAGTATYSASRDYKGYNKEQAPIEESCFGDTEFQLDIFGSYTDNRGEGYEDGLGGGIAANFFFARYIGIGVDGNIYDGDVNGVWDFSGRLIVRYPIEMGSFCIAPYAFGGGGLRTDGILEGTWHAGGGLEWRATRNIGIFGEGRYTWADEQEDAAQARLGVRFVF